MESILFFATGAYVYQTNYVGREVNVEETGHLIIDQSNEYLLVKDQILATPVFCSVQKHFINRNFKYKIINFSKKFEEIKYEYEVKVRDTQNAKS